MKPELFFVILLGLIWSTLQILSRITLSERGKHESAMYFFTYIVTWATLLILVLDTGKIPSPISDYLAYAISGAFVIFLIWLYLIPKLTHLSANRLQRISRIESTIGWILVCGEEISSAVMLFLAGQLYDAHYATERLNRVVGLFCQILQNCPAYLTTALQVPELFKIYVSIVTGGLGLMLSAILLALLMYRRGINRGRLRTIVQSSSASFE